MTLPPGFSLSPPAERGERVGERGTNARADHDRSGFPAGRPPLPSPLLQGKRGRLGRWLVAGSRCPAGRPPLPCPLLQRRRGRLSRRLVVSWQCQEARHAATAFLPGGETTPPLGPLPYPLFHCVTAPRDTAAPRCLSYSLAAARIRTTSSPSRPFAIGAHFSRMQSRKCWHSSFSGSSCLM